MKSLLIMDIRTSRLLSSISMVSMLFVALIELAPQGEELIVVTEKFLEF
jgi:hypothetical protein